jgi:hypothetical protein
MTRRSRLQLSSVAYIQRGVHEVLEAACRPAGADAVERRRDQLGDDGFLQAVVAGQAEHEVHAVRLAPRHQRVAAEAGIAAQQGWAQVTPNGPRPAATDMRHDAGDLLHRPGRAIDVRAAQPGGQQMTAAEDVERQVAVAIVVAVEEAAFLVAMQRVVGGIEIEDDLFRRLLVGVEEEVDEQAFDRRRVMADLVVSRRLDPAQFQPVQRRFARQRRTVRSLRRQLAGQNRHHRIMPQLVVVVEVLIAECDADDALHHHGLDLVFHQSGCPRVGEAGGKALGQPKRTVGLAQQQGTGVRGNRAAVEARHHLAAFDR